MRSPARALLGFAVGLSAFAASPSAPAALLDEPPKLVTFKLDDPSAPMATSRLALLASFRNAAVEPSSGMRVYTSGMWAGWRREPWWQLRWQPPEPEQPVAALDPHVSAIDARLLADDAGGALFGFAPPLARAVTLAPEPAPSWLMRLAPAIGAPSVPALPTTGASFRSNGFDALWVLPPKKPIPDWRCRRRPVRMGRYGGESDVFSIVRCDGSVAQEAYDRLTLIAREATAPRPGELLPDEADVASIERGEWAPGVRLVHPRLLWVVQRIADAFPWRPIYVFSGYRHDPSFRTAKPGSHHSMHAEARALDILVMGVPNAALFKLCRQLQDVGCGFYPNNRFVHVDVRRPGSGHPYWIDVSAPSEPSRYVDSWPGVVDHGALVWDVAARRAKEPPLGSEANCTRRAQ